MITIVPNYYHQFHCIADKCTHSCCVGWEIDIDEESLKRYQQLDGPLGEKLKENIELNPLDADAPAHFKLAEGERCPFLDACNLCEIYAQLGEEAWCQICTDHPRYRNYWTNITEVGLGMACEEAARLILSQQEPVQLIVIEDDRWNEPMDEDELELWNIRNDLFQILQNREKCVDERVMEMMEYFQLDTTNLHAVEGKIDEIACEQFVVYLLYRHYADVLYDGRLTDRIQFIATSYFDVRNQWAQLYSQNLDAYVEIARAFSQKIEYDTDTWGLEG